MSKVALRLKPNCASRAISGLARVGCSLTLPSAGLSGTVRFDWAALDAWFEEDEQVFVHPRNPYVRVDALRSTRPVRVELDGVVLGESPSPVMVLETGLPTRYYLNPTEVSFEYLGHQRHRHQLPLQGHHEPVLVGPHRWHGARGSRVVYDFPTRQLLPITGLVASYNEKVDIFLSGQRLERPRTHFFVSADDPAVSSSQA